MRPFPREGAANPMNPWLQTLPPQWLVCRDCPWFALTVRALFRPEPVRQQALLQHIGWPNMPVQVWQWAVSAFMLALKFTCPTPTFTHEDEVWMRFEKFLEKNEFESVNNDGSSF